MELYDRTGDTTQTRPAAERDSLLVPPMRRVAARPETTPEPGGIVKPLPPDLFIRHGRSAEMRWEAMRGQGYHTPADRFFVRNHTVTPLIDARTWRLLIHGDGVRRPISLSYEELLALPATTADVAIECAGNGRAFFDTQQDQPAPGIQWRLGAVGVARWRGVPLAALLDRAGLTPGAVDVMPRGLDPVYVEDGVDQGHVRRPLPLAKALEDVLVAYEMNDRPLPADHGFPARLVVPGWSGIASIKWLGDVEVSTVPLSSPWNTRSYRMFGPGHPIGGAPLAAQVVKSAFELPWEATLRAGRQHILHGRSWSGTGRVVGVEISTDGGRTWTRAETRGPRLARAWAPWHLAWVPHRPGPHVLMARATDETGAVQPARARFNMLGYHFDGLVEHPVTVVS
ncbi:sulfite oxidase [Sphaerisporangium melleum]|uniref:Sulfite oxidase n=1 Tax=Sphaerisporangium melleum TaxID=321316 RepID=A0A917VEJ0_9ACTN|nr:sulfite oxidase [Sphaerisporangium melleum]GGK66528.1 sulfite oxidase [Sphaerisporangium melleum]GII68583.1 sulfite oxidase [Sphaerisporangium melleum]